MFNYGFTCYYVRFINCKKERKENKEKLKLISYFSANEMSQALVLWLKDNQFVFKISSGYNSLKRNNTK